MKKGIQNIQEQKFGLVEKNEELYIVWRLLATLEQHSKYLPIQTSDWQRDPVSQSLATIDQLVELVDNYKTLQIGNMSKLYLSKKN